MEPTSRAHTYLVSLKFLAWLFIITHIFTFSLAVFETLYRTKFVLWHSLHVLFPVIVLAIHNHRKHDDIAWGVGISIVVILIDIGSTVFRIIDLVNCTPVICTEGSSPFIFMLVASIIFVVIAIIVIVVLFNLRTTTYARSRTRDGRVYALGAKE